MKCFGYLSVKQYKMTAPVVMECKPDADPIQPAASDGMPVPIERMHFLLEKNSLDVPQDLGQIKVADMPSIRVLSIAYQGDVTREAVKAGQAAIESRLKEMPGIGAAGNTESLAITARCWNTQRTSGSYSCPYKIGPIANSRINALSTALNWSR